MLSALPLWLRVSLSLFAAGALCHLSTPFVRRLALRLGAVDRPGGRRVNRRPVPRMGGLAICAGFLAAVLLFSRRSLPLAGLLAGALLIAAMGAADDLLGLRPGIKLLAQFAAALLAIRGGVIFSVLSLPSGGFLLLPRPLSLALTLLWIVGCTNALNLIDGLDGLAAGLSAVGSLTLLFVSLLLAEPGVTLLLAALNGACLGFLPYNRSPARIFMGDLGSQFLGFVLACASVLGMFKLHAAVGFFAPLLALSVPLTDTAFAVLRRLLRGQNPFRADRGHIHHRLLDLGMSQRQTVAALCAFSSLLGLLAVLLTDAGGRGRFLCLLPSAAAFFCVRLLLLPRALGAKKGKPT